MKYFNELVETYCTQNGIDLKSLIENKNNGAEKKTNKSHQKLQNDKTQNRSSSGYVKTSGFFTENFSEDFRFKGCTSFEGFRSFEGNSEKPSDDFHMPSTSNTPRYNSFDTNHSPTHQVATPNLPTQIITNDWKKVLRSKRPFDKMGFYQLHELSGIVPDSIFVAFQHEQQSFLENNLKKELKKAPNKRKKKRTKQKVRTSCIIVLNNFYHVKPHKPLSATKT